MGQGRILLRPACHVVPVAGGAEDAQRAHTHESAVGLAVRVGMPAQAKGDGPAHVEGAALQPEKITAAGFFGIIFHGFGQQAGQHEGHSRVVRGLPGQDVPGTAVFQQTGSIGIAFADGGRGTELHQTAQGIPGDLAHETTGGTVEQGIGMAGHGTSFLSVDGWGKACGRACPSPFRMKIPDHRSILWNGACRPQLCEGFCHHPVTHIFFLKSRSYALVWLRAQPGGGRCGKIGLLTLMRPLRT